MPFGGKTTTGIVIGVSDECEYNPEKVKEIIYVLEETPALTEETLALCEYVRKKCFVPRALALRLFLPSEMRKGTVREIFDLYYSLTDGLDLEKSLYSLSISTFIEISTLIATPSPSSIILLNKL